MESKTKIQDDEVGKCFGEQKVKVQESENGKGPKKHIWPDSGQLYDMFPTSFLTCFPTSFLVF